MPERDVVLWTVGHSTRSADDLLALLHEHDIALLVDVRRFPGSRRHPQFGAEALAASLRAEGVAYLHAPDLGGRRPPRRDSPNVAWREPGFRGYADYSVTARFRAALDDLMEHARATRVAILCAEALPWRCHRRLIADQLVLGGWEVRHILAPGRSERHELHPAARRTADGHVVYGSGGGQLGLFSEP